MDEDEDNGDDNGHEGGSYLLPTSAFSCTTMSLAMAAQWGWLVSASDTVDLSTSVPMGRVRDRAVLMPPEEPGGWGMAVCGMRVCVIRLRRGGWQRRRDKGCKAQDCCCAITQHPYRKALCLIKEKWFLNQIPIR